MIVARLQLHSFGEYLLKAHISIHYDMFAIDSNYVKFPDG